MDALWQGQQYHVRNGWLDMKMATNFVDGDMLGNLWLIDIRLFDEELRLHVCFNLEAEPLRTRSARP